MTRLLKPLDMHVHKGSRPEALDVIALSTIEMKGAEHKAAVIPENAAVPYSCATWTRLAFLWSIEEMCHCRTTWMFGLWPIWKSNSLTIKLGCPAHCVLRCQEGSDTCENFFLATENWGFSSANPSSVQFLYVWSKNSKGNCYWIPTFAPSLGRTWRTEPLLLSDERKIVGLLLSDGKKWVSYVSWSFKRWRISWRGPSVRVFLLNSRAFRIFGSLSDLSTNWVGEFADGEDWKGGEVPNTV